MTPDALLPGQPFAVEHPFAALALYLLVLGVLAATLWLLHVPSPRKRHPAQRSERRPHE